MKRLKVDKEKIYGKVRMLFGAAALFLLLMGMTVQAAGTEITKNWLANKGEWDSRQGYHLGEAANIKECGHHANDEYVIAVSIKGSELKPDKEYLKDNFHIAGAKDKMSQRYKDQIDAGKIIWETADVSGTNSSQVSNRVAKLKVNGTKITLAKPYLCPDGYAGYAYFRHYFSYCKETGEIYYTGTAEHVWLACTRGDLGVNEYHPKEFNHKLYRYYIEPNSYKVIFDKNGGSGTMADQKAKYDTAFSLKTNSYTRTGYTFAGWNTKKDGTGTFYRNKEEVKNLTSKDGGEITLYAQWKVNTLKICYHANGGQAKPGYTLKNQLVQKDSAVLMQEIDYKDTSLNLYNVATLLTRSGYSIDAAKAWSIGSAAGTKISQEEGTPVPRVLKDMMKEKSGQTVILYANWKVNSYQLTVKPNGGTWGGKTTNQSFTLNYKATKSIANPTRMGYTFTGWSISGAGSSLKGQAFTMGTANAVLTANWKANTYIICFNGNGATEGSMEDVTAGYDQEISLPEKRFKRVTEQGESVFVGWNRNPDVFKAEFQDKEIVKNLTAGDSAEVILYAIWDDCPQINAVDRYFTLDFAKAGRITEEELLSTASAADEEDKELENRTSSQIAESGINGSLSLYGYAATDFSGMTDSGSVSMTYKAVDSMGNIAYETVTVFITNTEPLLQTDFQYIRFINEKYYAASYENGGLHEKSVWRNDTVYQNTLKKAFSNLKNDTPEETYTFTYNDEKENSNRAEGQEDRESHIMESVKERGTS